jgi:hypothetical protein
MTTRTGGCHCGRVRFEIPATLRDVSTCHCGLCRRLDGSAFTAYCEVTDAELRWLQGAEGLVRYAATARLEKLFCAHCGSGILTRHDSSPGCNYVNLGALDDDAGIRLEYHQFVGSKAAWHEIGGDARQYDGWPDS